MRKFVLNIASILALFLVTVSPAAAQNNNTDNLPENFRHGENVILRPDETINSDFFASGEKVVISGTVEDDAYVAGGNVTVDGTINGDLLVTGGNVNIRGLVLGDVRAAGGNIDIEGRIGKNLTVVGGSVDLSNTASIGGNLVAGVGNLDVRAPIAGDAHIGAGNVDFNSSISNVNAGVGELTLGPEASVSGNLNYWSENPAQITDDATVSGALNFNRIERDQRSEEEARKAVAGAGAGINLYGYLMGLALGIILLLLVPNFFQRVANEIKTNPWRSFGWGFLILIVTPIAFVLLLITILGIPLAFVLLFAYILLLVFASLFTSLVVGEWIFKKFDRKSGPKMNFVLGFSLLSLIGIVPVIGWLISFIAMLLGLGALINTKYNLYQELRTKKII